MEALPAVVDVIDPGREGASDLSTVGARPSSTKRRYVTFRSSRSAASIARFSRKRWRGEEARRGRRPAAPPLPAMTGSVRRLADPRDPQYQQDPDREQDTHAEPEADL